MTDKVVVIKPAWRDHLLNQENRPRQSAGKVHCHEVSSRATQLTDLRRCSAFILLGAISLIIWWRPLVSTLSRAFWNSEYTHLFLILPISVALIILQRRSVLKVARLDVSAGLPLLALAVLVDLWTKIRPNVLAPDLKLFASMLALVTWWIGMVVFCFGTRVVRILVFPILFLFWLAPLPDFALGRIVAALQQASASATHLLFICTGVPVSKDGVVLSIPGLNIEVARECSSIRSSLMLVITSMVSAHLLLRSVWRKGVVILAAVPLSIVKNAVRIFTLSMLATHVDPGFLTGRLHQQGGVVFFSLSVIALWLLILTLQNRDIALGRKPGRLAKTAEPAIFQ